MIIQPRFSEMSASIYVGRDTIAAAKSSVGVDLFEHNKLFTIAGAVTEGRLLSLLPPL